MISKDEKITNDDTADVISIFRNVRSTLSFFFPFSSLKTNLVMDANIESEKNIARRTGSLSMKLSISNEMFINV